MLKKHEPKETGPVSVPSTTENNPTLVKTNGGDSEKSSVAISVENMDMPRVQPKKLFEIGSTLLIRGELSADEDILIQGTVEGTIVHHKKNLVVGKQGRINGVIHADFVTIEGRVDGDIHGEVLVRLAKSAQVSEDIFCPRVCMDDGARLNGTVYMK